jgi:Arc/MetJ family transcription regulator
MCWCRLQSSVSFQFCQGTGEPHFASELSQASVSLRGRNQLQSSTDGLSDAGTAGSLCFFEEPDRYLHRDLARCIHNAVHYTVFNTSIEYGILSGETRQLLNNTQKCEMFTHREGRAVRTNIEIDDDLMRQAMRRSGAPTKKAAVEEALRLLVKTHEQTSIRRWRGKVQWEGNLKELRRSRVPQ